MMVQAMGIFLLVETPLYRSRFTFMNWQAIQISVIFSLRSLKAENKSSRSYAGFLNLFCPAEALL